MQVVVLEILQKIILQLLPVMEGLIFLPIGWLGQLHSQVIQAVVPVGFNYEETIYDIIFNYKIETFPCRVIKTGVLKISTPITLTNISIKDVVCGGANDGAINLTIVGGADIANQLLEHNLLDTMRLFVCPEDLGSGTQAFKDDTAYNNFTLVDEKQYSSGIVEEVYSLNNPTFRDV